MKYLIKTLGSLTLLLVFSQAPDVYCQTTAFIYQGRLTDGGNPATGNFLMQFKLFDALAAGTQVGSTLNDVAVTVTDGTFRARLDFGSAPLSGANRWLEIAVRRNSGESYVTLSPREQIASSPYAVRTLSAAMADDSQKLGGVNAADYLTTASANNSFIRNGTQQQTATFNISGNGLFGGQVGINTGINPNFHVDILGGTRTFSTSAAHFVAETIGGTNSWARYYIRSPSRSWFIGTSQNFNGNQLYLVDETGGQTRFSIQPDGGAITFPFGNVGIGSTNPQSGLELRGSGLQNQQRITDSVSGNSLVLQGGAGSNMKVTGFNYGSFTPVPLYLSVDGANTVLNSGGGNVGIGTATPNARLSVVGSVTQDLGSYGLPKAMLFVLANGTISRCWNGVTNNSGGTCGFSVTIPPSTFGPRYEVNLGFSVGSRFVALIGSGGSTHIPSRILSLEGNVVTAVFWDTNETLNRIPSDFFLIVH